MENETPLESIASKRLKILISAWGGTRNTGDNAIILCEIRRLREIFPNAEFSIFSQGIDEFLLNKLNLKVVSNRLNNILGIIKVIKETDIFVLGGGGLIQEKSSYFTPIHHLYKVFIASTYNKQIFSYGLGIGSIKSFPNRFLVRYAFNSMRLIIVRDVESEKNLLDIDRSLSKNIKVTSDCVISLNKFNGKIENNSNKIAFCLRDWFIYNRFLSTSLIHKFKRLPSNDLNKLFIKNIIHAISKLKKLGYEIHLIPFEGKRDEEFNLKISSSAKGVIIHEYQQDPIEVLKLIGEMDLIVGMRLHSLIFGAVQNTKLISLNYSSKVTAFMNSLSLKTNQLDPLFSPDKLIKLIQDELSFSSVGYQKELSLLKKIETTSARLIGSYLKDGCS